MSQYQNAYTGEYPTDPRRSIYPIRLTGKDNSPIGADGTHYIEPIRATVSGNPTDWLIVDRAIVFGSVQWLQPEGGSLYIYVSPDGVGTFGLCHILTFPGDNGTYSFGGLEIFGFAARFRVHSPVASNNVNIFLNVRSV